jgi:predicted transcriptional regulator of viral defense system
MITRNTILSQSDLSILEKVIIKRGKVASFDDLREAFGSDYSYQEIKNRVSQLVHTGWLIRLKRGLYVIITDISTLGFNDIHQFAISQMLNTESYISFEAALQHYGMFDQMIKRIDGVTARVARSYDVQDNTYRFYHIKNELYFGFSAQFVEKNFGVNVADKEKALLDILYFRVSNYSMSIVLEKLQDYKHEIDFNKLQDYAKRYGTGMVRKVGFLLDSIDVNSEKLYNKKEVKKNSFSKFDADAHDFNAKWRVYYDTTIFK